MNRVWYHGRNFSIVLEVNIIRYIMVFVVTAVKWDLPFFVVFLVNLVITREFVTCVDHFPVNRHFVVEHVIGGERTQLPK